MLSSGGDNYTMHCRICGQESRGEFDYITVAFPTIVFPDGTIKGNWEDEIELFYNESTGYPFGVRVDIYTHDLSNYSDVTVRNITEFHYLFDSIIGDEQVALESDLHSFGGTKPLNVIKLLKISKETEMQASYYN